MLKDIIDSSPGWDNKPYYYPRIENMIGLTFDRVYQDGDCNIVFEHPEGTFIFTHHQNCCEDVHIESIVGDLEDLEGTELLKAKVTVSHDLEECESGTWTFYKFATIKGYVDIRWVGYSNGYYSEEVDLVFEEPKGDRVCR